MNNLHENRRQNNRLKPIQTKLDEMASAEAKGLLTSGGSIISNVPEKKGKTSDDSVSPGDGTHFKNRTEVFDLDFPQTPKVPKGKSKNSKPKYHSSQHLGVSAMLIESDTDLELDIRQSGVVASNYLCDAMSTDEDANGQVADANNTENISQKGM